MIEHDTISIKGVARATLGKEVRVPFRHRYLDKDTAYLDVRVAARETMPDLCDIFWGLRCSMIKV